MGHGCARCGDDTRILHKCRHCGRSHCPSHLLPENHGCVGLRATGESIEIWVENEERFGGRGKTLKGSTKELPRSRSSRKETRGNSRSKRSRGGRRWGSEESSGVFSEIAVLAAVVILILAAVVAFGPQTTAGDGSILDGNYSIAEGTPPPDVQTVVSESETNEPPTQPAAGSPEFRRAVGEGVIDYTNRERDGNGLPALQHDGRLSELSREHSAQMADDGNLYHSEYDGTCRAWGENVALSWYNVPLTGGRFHTTPDGLAEGLVIQWMESPGHRENILREGWSKIGVGIAVVEQDGNLAVYATQMFCS